MVCSNEVKLVKSVFDAKLFHTLITRFAKNKLRTDLLQPAIDSTSSHIHYHHDQCHQHTYHIFYISSKPWS